MVETYTYAGVGGRVSRRQTTVDGRTITLDLTWTDLGRPSSVTYPDDAAIADPSRTVSHTYAWGLLTAISGYASSISYHPNLMVKDLVNANGVTWTQQIADGAGGRPHDAMGRPYSIGITGASTSWSVGPYTYDGAGDIKAIGSESFVYDKVLRLTSGTIVSGGSKTQTASYNAFGFFLTNLTTNGSSQGFSEVSGTNRISGASYNAAGSMTGWGSYTYTWDPLNQMASVFGGSMTKRTFLYTADGERIEERVGSDPLNPTSIVLAARGLDGKVLRLQTYASGTWSWTKDTIYRDGAQLASVESAGTRYSHLDHLGTIRRATNTATPPAIVASHDYYPFGYEATDPCQDAERMKWTGHERDNQGTCSSQGDDLDYMHARFENFNIGRFLSLDPVRGNPKSPQSFNLFAYATNNPINRIDPLGLQSVTPEPKGAGGVIPHSDSVCDNPDDTTDPACEAYKQEQQVKEENARKWAELVRSLNSLNLGVAKAAVLGYVLVASSMGQASELVARIQNHTFPKDPDSAVVALLGLCNASGSWKLGSFKSGSRWQSQMARRGWTTGQIDEAIAGGERFPAANHVNSGNSATRYVHPETGRSVVVDNVTGEVLHVGGDGFLY